MDSFYDVFTGIQEVLQNHFEGCPGNVLSMSYKIWTNLHGQLFKKYEDTDF